MKLAAVLALCFVFLALGATSVQAGEIECGVCTYLVGAVESYVASNHTEQEILTLLSNTCSDLKIASWVSVCKGTVMSFGPEIINLVLEKQPADVVCSEVKLCNSSAVPAKIVPPPAVDNLGNGTLECDICQFLVHEIEVLISQNKTETEILDGIEDVCKHLPISSWQTACADVVQEYGSAIIKFVENENPDTACHMVGDLCPASESKVAPLPSKPKHW
eukprot:Phypoly_transcript_19266.p2 GENE.Phypoly_transcript_19266~~Phypoly_transcript_19266.p2  ORF type:complete len:219 (-),score=45.18 Phypoly_transcript_19266:34-690(-)